MVLFMDNDGHFTPSQWACKVAGNTSRNAWRDIGFQLKGQKGWTLAQTMRQQATRNGSGGE